MRGSVLYSHVDRVSTHVVSVIINVDQSVDKVGRIVCKKKVISSIIFVALVPTDYGPL